MTLRFVADGIPRNRGRSGSHRDSPVESFQFQEEAGAVPDTMQRRSSQGRVRKLGQLKRELEKNLSGGRDSERTECLRARIAALEEAARPFLDFFDDLDPDACSAAQKRLAEVLERK